MATRRRRSNAEPLRGARGVSREECFAPCANSSCAQSCARCSLENIFSTQRSQRLLTQRSRRLLPSSQQRSLRTFASLSLRALGVEPKRRPEGATKPTGGREANLLVASHRPAAGRSVLRQNCITDGRSEGCGSHGATEARRRVCVEMLEFKSSSPRLSAPRRRAVLGWRRKGVIDDE